MEVRIKDDDRRWRKILDRLREPGKNAFVSIGYHSDAEPYERGQEEAANVAQIASFHEFGTATMPARPTMGPTVDTNRDKYGDLLDRAFALVLDGKLTMRKAFALVGEQVVADVKQAITDLKDPPLAPSTIAAKMRQAAYLGPEKVAAYGASGAQPLISSGHMRASVTYKVNIAGTETGSKADDQ